MALSAKVSNISAPASTGDVDSPSLGFDPKAVIAFYGSQTATGGSADSHFGFGFSGTAAEDVSTYSNSDDGVTTSDTVRSTLTTAFLKSTVAGATTARITATMSSMGTDKFTTNFSATVNGVKHSFLALGGTDVTNAAAGTVASNTTTANFSVTGLGFQPDIVFLSVQLITGTGTANNNSVIGFGVAKSSSERWCMVMRSQNAQADANTARGFYNNRCLVLSSAITDNVVDEYDFVSMDSDGFTLSHPTSSGTAWGIVYLAIKGGQWALGTFNQATSTGVQTSVSGLAFQPVGIILGSAGHDTANTITTTARMSFGAASSTTSREAIFAGDEDAAATMKADSYYATDKVIVLCDEAGGGSPTVLAAADLDSFNSGGFSLNWTTADSTQRIIGYVAFGSTAPTSLSVSVSDSITITESVNATKVLTVTVNDSVTITESVTSALGTPLLQTLVENFNDNSISSTLWTADTHIAEANKQLEISTQTTAVYDVLTSKGHYDLTGSYAFIQFKDIGASGLVEDGIEISPLELTLDANNKLFFLLHYDADPANYKFDAYKKVAGVTTALTNVSYNATNHQWVRIRESAGTIHWETSADGVSWSSFHTLANPFAVTNLSFALYAGTDFSSLTARTVKFDNLNVNAREIEVSDSITITESVAITKVLTLSVNDAITITESVTLTKILTLSVNDAVAITENLTSSPIAASNLTTNGDNTDATSYTTASIAPTANRLILAWVWAIGADAPPEPTLTGNGLTWVSVATTVVGARRLTLFRAMGASPSSGAVTIDFAGDTQTGCIWSIAEFSGVNTSGSNGANAIVQAVADNTASNVTSFTVTLATFESPNNATAGGFGIPLNTAGLPDPGSGFSEIGQRNQSSPNLAFVSEFRNDNDTSVDATWGASTVPAAGIAVELRRANANGVLVIDNISVNDAITITDVPTTSVPFVALSVSDAITITESASVAVFVGALPDRDIVVFDSVQVTDVPQVIGIFCITVADQVSISESIVIENALLGVSVNDAIAVTESVSLGTTVTLSVVDSLTISESVSVTAHLGNISVFDAVTITESAGANTVYNIAVHDAVTITESVNVSKVLAITVNDAIAITENVSTRFMIKFVGIPIRAVKGTRRIRGIDG